MALMRFHFALLFTVSEVMNLQSSPKQVVFNEQLNATTALAAARAVAMAHGGVESDVADVRIPTTFALCPMVTCATPIEIHYPPVAEDGNGPLNVTVVLVDDDTDVVMEHSVIHTSPSESGMTVHVRELGSLPAASVQGLGARGRRGAHKRNLSRLQVTFSYRKEIRKEQSEAFLFNKKASYRSSKVFGADNKRVWLGPCTWAGRMLGVDSVTESDPAYAALVTAVNAAETEWCLAHPGVARFEPTEIDKLATSMLTRETRTISALASREPGVGAREEDGQPARKKPRVAKPQATPTVTEQGTVTSNTSSAVAAAVRKESRGVEPALGGRTPGRQTRSYATAHAATRAAPISAAAHAATPLAATRSFGSELVQSPPPGAANAAVTLTADARTVPATAAQAAYAVFLSRANELGMQLAQGLGDEADDVAEVSSLLHGAETRMGDIRVCLPASVCRGTSREQSNSSVEVIDIMCAGLSVAESPLSYWNFLGRSLSPDSCDADVSRTVLADWDDFDSESFNDGITPPTLRAGWGAEQGRIGAAVAHIHTINADRLDPYAPLPDYPPPAQAPLQPAVGAQLAAAAPDHIEMVCTENIIQEADTLSDRTTWIHHAMTGDTVHVHTVLRNLDLTAEVDHMEDEQPHPSYHAAATWPAAQLLVPAPSAAIPVRPAVVAAPLAPPRSLSSPLWQEVADVITCRI